MGEIDKWMETQENKKYELAEEKKYNHFKYPQPRIILTAVLRTKEYPTARRYHTQPRERH
jgi:lipopolysaccharide biosynthesis glycosyltransferase